MLPLCEYACLSCQRCPCVGDSCSLILITEDLNTHHRKYECIRRPSRRCCGRGHRTRSGVLHCRRSPRTSPSSAPPTGRLHRRPVQATLLAVLPDRHLTLQQAPEPDVFWRMHSRAAATHARNCSNRSLSVTSCWMCRAHLAVLHALPAHAPRGAQLQAAAATLLLHRLVPPLFKVNFAFSRPSYCILHL